MNDILINYILEEIIDDPEMGLEPDDDLLNTGTLDSMGIMRLIAFVEEKYEFKVPPEDMVIENFVSVSALSNYINQKTN